MPLPRKSPSPARRPSVQWRITRKPGRRLKRCAPRFWAPRPVCAMPRWKPRAPRNCVPAVWGRNAKPCAPASRRTGYAQRLHRHRPISRAPMLGFWQLAPPPAPLKLRLKRPLRRENKKLRSFARWRWICATPRSNRQLMALWCPVTLMSAKPLPLPSNRPSCFR